MGFPKKELVFKHSEAKESKLHKCQKYRLYSVSVIAYPGESEGKDISVHYHVNLKRHRVVFELLSEIPYSEASLQGDNTRPYKDHHGLELHRRN